MATAARATNAKTLDENSGVVVVRTELVVVAEVLALLLVLVVETALDEVLVLDVEVVLPVDDETVGKYVNVKIFEAVPVLPPHVALTVNVPAVQAGFAPGTKTPVKLPVTASGNTSLMSATLPTEFLIKIITPVLGPGAGEMVPVIVMGWEPEYEDASLCKVILNVVAPRTGTKA